MRYWREAGERDNEMLRDYEPGAFAPLDMPGEQGCVAVLVTGFLCVGLFLRVILWQVFS